MVRPSLLAHWSNQLILVPYAPDSTSFLKEPDTHEHGQFKATIRQLKSELNFDLELEAENQEKECKNIKWGPNEYVYICAKAFQLK